jgi:hypothetical protein
MTPAEKAEAARLIENDRCSEWVLSHHAGPMYWLRNLTRTFNFHWQQQGRLPEEPFPFKPFTGRSIDVASLPFKHEFGRGIPCPTCKQHGFQYCTPDYLDVLIGFMLFTKDIAKHDELWIPKSREMLTSWSAVGYVTWHCQFRPQIEWIGQSEDDLKAMGNIKYSNALYSNQPDWMKAMHPLASGAEGTSHKIEWATGSLFRALPSGVRKFASSHALWVSER